MPTEQTTGSVSTEALVLLASRPVTVEVAVENLSPKVVGLILSQEILAPVVAKCRELGNRAGPGKPAVEFRYRLVDSPMEIGDAFGRFEHLLAELKAMRYGHEDVLLDATGGTTPMRLGAALGAMRHGVRMVHQRVPLRYVGEEWERDRSKPIEVFLMGNPLEETGLLRERQAIELFNRRDYAASALVFEDVVEKVTGVERVMYYRGLLFLAQGYGAWDVADYATALGRLRDALKELHVDFADPSLATRSASLVTQIRENLPFLGKVQREEVSVENVIDMLENARRRIRDQGRYDDGVARLYRCVEMWHQWRLWEKHFVSTNRVDWNKLGERVKKQFSEVTGATELPEMLDLTRARTLDKILSGDQAADEMVLRDLLQQRNNSILAHGLEPIGKKAAERFLRYVDEVVEESGVRARAEHASLTGL